MPTENFYEELKCVLLEFKQFLDQNVSVLRTAIRSLVQLLPETVEFIDTLIQLMSKLRAKIDVLDPGLVPGIEQVSTFTAKVKAVLRPTKKLLPDEARAVNAVAAVADLVGDLPSLNEVKSEILSLIDAITAHLNTIRPQ